MNALIKFMALCILIPLNMFATKYELSICTIFQNDAEFLKEWIEFHRLQGVEHFYLYNNNSEDNFREVLKPYIKNKIVTLTEWPYTYGQSEAAKWIEIQSNAYMHCINLYRDKTKWLAVIDSDEFLFCPDGKKIPDFLKDYTIYGGVLANWLLFGTSDVEDIPPDRLMIEMLIKCAPEHLNNNNRVKSIVQPKYVCGGGSAHIFKYIDGYYAVDVNHERCDKQNCHIIHEKLRINHYWSRTMRYFREYKIPSRQGRRDRDTEAALIGREKFYNKKENTEILQFVPELRKRMGLD